MEAYWSFKKNLFKIIIISFSSICFGQEKIYTGNTDLELFVNREAGFSNQPQIAQGFGAELNSYHGIFVFRGVALQAGLGIVFNVNENFKALPATVQLKVHLSDSEEDGFYAMINTGVNLKIGSFVAGQTAKLGIGYNYELNGSLMCTLSVFAKGKQYRIENDNFSYFTNSLGISFGIQL